MNKLAEKSELLSQALEQLESGQETVESFLAKVPEHAEELRPKLEAALWLRLRKQSLDARPGFMTDSRAHLERNLQSAQPSVKRVGIFQRWFATPLPRNPLLETLSLLTLIVCVVFVAHNVILMSALSLPGEPFYAVKLSLEQSRLAFTFDPQKDALLQIEMSQQRTSEIIELILNQDYQALPHATQRMEKHLLLTLTSLQEMKKSNPLEGQQLEQSYAQALATENMILSILLDTYPVEERQYIEMALQVTARGLAYLQD